MIGRRELMGGIIGMGAAGGIGAPRPDQHYEPPEGGQAVPGAKAAVRARQVIIFGTGPHSGLFVYSPAPGPGNLIASITANGGTDPFGNTVLAGIAEYHEVTPTFFTAVQLQSGEVTFYDAPAQPGPWTSLYVMNAAPAFAITETPGSNQIAMSAPGGPTALLVNGESQLSGSAVINGDALATALAITAGALQQALSVTGGATIDTATVDGVTNVNGNQNNVTMLNVSNLLGNGGHALVQLTTPNATDRALGIQLAADTNERVRIDQTPAIHLGSGIASPDCTIGRGGAGQLAMDYIAYSNNGGTVEAWNAVGAGGNATFQNSWANAASGPALQYRRVAAPYNSIEWVGRIVAPAGVALNQAVTGSPSNAYKPANVQEILGWDVTVNTIAIFHVGTGGALTFVNSLAPVGAGDTIVLIPALPSLDA